MAENIVIDFVANTEGLQPAVSAIEDITKADAALGTEFKKTNAVFTDRQKALDQQNKSSTAAKLTLDQLSNSVKELNKNVIGNASTKQVSDFADKLGVATKQSGTLTTQLRALREQLSAMETAGRGGTRAFTDLAVRAAKLQDQIGDTAQRIRILASDTKNLDAALSVGTGLAGAFAVAQGASALFGKENEDLQKALLKVQAALAVLNGLQAVAATLNKDSAASVVLFGSAAEGTAAKTGIYGFALRTVTAIQTAFGISAAAAWALATGGITLLIAGVVALIDYFGALNQEVEFQKRLQQELKDTADANDKADNQRAVDVAKRDLELAKIRKASLEEIHQLELNLNSVQISVYEKIKERKGFLDEQDFLAYKRLQDDRQLIDARYSEALLDTTEETMQKLDKLQKEHNAKLLESEKDARLKRLTFIQIPVEDEPEAQQAVKVKDFVVKTLQEKIAAIDKINDDQKKKDLERDLEYVRAYAAIVDQLLQFNVEAANNELAALRDKNQKGLISEKEYAKQVAIIERKQAVAEKAKAAFNIALATAEALVRAFPNAVLMAAAGVLGAIQLAAVAARPLPEIPAFAKGTENVKGGIRGKDSVPAILMPGERIVPAHINAQLGDIPNADLPKLLGVYPDLPYISSASMNAMEKHSSNSTGINYELLGKSVAKYLGDEIKKHPRSVTNVDRNGFTNFMIEDMNKKKSLDDYYSSKS